jgi:hypothetical protein
VTLLRLHFCPHYLGLPTDIMKTPLSAPSTAPFQHGRLQRFNFLKKIKLKNFFPDNLDLSWNLALKSQKERVLKSPTPSLIGSPRIVITSSQVAFWLGNKKPNMFR